MLNQLGNEKIYYEDPLFVSRSAQSGKVTAIAFNYPKEYEEKVPSAQNFSNYMIASSKELDVTFVNLTPGTVFEIEILDKDHGNVYNAYQQMGAPHSPSKAEISTLKQKAWDTIKEVVKVDASGCLKIKYKIEPWSCILIREL